MNNWKCIIIDDEEHAVGMLKERINKIANLDVVGTFYDGLTALEQLRAGLQVDMIFSDIDMPDLNGIEAASLLRPYCKYLIFVTAHSEYALNAFSVNADGFLLKPISLAQLLEKIDFLRNQEAILVQPAQSSPDYLFVKGGAKGTFIKIAYKNIVCIDSDDHFLNIITSDHKTMVYLTMKEIEKHLLEKPDFVRISKSCIISLTHLAKVDGNRVYLEHIEESIRDIGETYRKSFHEMVSKMALKPFKK